MVHIRGVTSREGGFDIDEMSQYLDQTILLIDKVFNSVSYSRRMNVLIGLGTEKVKAKNTLKKQASLLEEDSKELSGKSFRKQMIATAKAVYRKSRVNNSGKTLFRESPSLQKQNGGGGDLYHLQCRSTVEVNQHHHNHLKGLKHHGSQKEHLVRVSSTKKETFLNITSPLPKTHFPEIVPIHQLENVHPLVLNFFPKGEIGNFPHAGRLQYFLENWKILKNQPKILEWISGLKIDFQEELFQEKVPHQAQM